MVATALVAAGAVAMLARQYAGERRGLPLAHVALLVAYEAFMLGVCPLACVVTTADAAHAQERTRADRAALVARLGSLVNAPVKEGRAAGISVAVVHGRDTLLPNGYGKANTGLEVPMHADAVQEIGSVTKPFTAAAILQLRDSGLLSRADDLARSFPDCPTHGRATPLRRLLDHASRRAPSHHGSRRPLPSAAVATIA